ncbi:MAG: hypothetical protein NT144_11775 [Bacteroidia bacterium]|nr:hypothetical protein [Bacteroidia bacterium]
MKVIFVIVLFFAGSIIKINAQTEILVNTNSVIATGVSNKYGINLNAGMDADANRPDARPLYQALQELGVKHLRYPGGKKSLYYSFAAAPYNDPTTQFWTGYYKDDALNYSLNFDQFMTICNQTGASPHINVAYNPGAGFGPDLAAAWVKYANVTKKYDIKYWEIGNEMFKPELGFTVTTLAAVVKLYSKSMKAVDPTIKIGVSWSNTKNIINACGTDIDFVTCSNYEWELGNSALSSYNTYATTNDVNLVKVDATATLQSVVSEYNSITWNGTPWDLTNNTGKGLINFDHTGQFLKNAKVDYANFWNTRWYNNTKPINNALDDKNDLTPVAKSLTLWAKFIKDKLVSTTGSTSIVTYAAYDSNTGDLNVFLINKATSAQSVNVTVTSANNYASPSQAWQYKGSGDTDENPTVSNTGTVTVAGNKIINMSLPAVSITTLLFVIY